MSVGGSMGSGCSPGDNPEDKICDCLGCSLESIASSTADIARILEEKLGNACDHIDECIDDIIQGINDRFSGPLQSCEGCKQMLAQGLGGTLEYAMRCASVTCDECVSICSSMDDGKCCTTCGQEDCICVAGQCLPVEIEPEEETEPKFIGWCNIASKVVVVTKQGEPSPGPTFEQVALAESEQVAFLEAESFCSSLVPPTDPTIPPPVPSFGNSALPFCSLNSLLDGSTLKVAADAQDEFFRTAGGLEFITRFADIGAFGINVGDIGQVIWGSAQMAAALPSYMASLASDAIPPIIGCDNPTFVQSVKLLGTLQNFTQQSGVNFDEFLMPYRYAMHAACPQIHLDVEKATAAHLANTLDRASTEGLWRIHGYCPEDVTAFLDGARAKPGALQLAVMRHREIIDVDRYHEAMRELGFTKPADSEKLFRITEQVPTLSDITQFMVRDADDIDLVNRFGLDAEFDKKYRGQLKQWARDQGVPDIIAQYAWRSHWKIPPPTQLFEFWHRLRKDKQFGTEAEQLEDIKAALIQQDILPYWHDRILAISFRPMRLRDIRRSFQIGTLTEAEAREQFQFLGYNDKTVDLMTDFLIRLRDNSVRNHPLVKQWYRFESDRATVSGRLSADGIPQQVIDDALTDVEPLFSRSVYARAVIRGDLHPDAFKAALQTAGVSNKGIDGIMRVVGLQIRNPEPLKDFAVGLIDEQTALSQMVDFGIPGEVAGALTTGVDKDITRKFLVTCQNGIKRRYLLGELSKGEAISELVTRGTTNSRAQTMADWWGCELKDGEKHVSANTLCEWLARGAITTPDFLSRLDKLGYSKTDAAIMLEDCLIKIDTRRLKQAQKEAKEQAAEQAKAQRAIERANRAVAQQLKQLEAARTKQARNRITRMRQLHTIVDKLTDKTKIDTGQAYEFIEGQRKRIMADFSLPIDLALQALLLTVHDFASESLGDFAQLLDSVAANVAESDVPGTEPQLSTQNGNGQAAQ